MEKSGAIIDLKEGSGKEDFGLSKIANYLGKNDALALYWEAADRENEGNIDGAIRLYKQAFRKWPALDSVTDGGLPRAVRAEAQVAGIFSGLLSLISVNEARQSGVICMPNFLSSDDIDEVDALRKAILTKESSLLNNPQNSTHKHKTCTFLNNPPEFLFQSQVPSVLDKMLQFAAWSWKLGEWSGKEGCVGPLSAVTGGLASLSIRVVEYWEYEVGGGLVDPLHYDVDSVITIVALLADEYEGGVFRTNEVGDQQLEHVMRRGDALCFVSHKYHNITPVTKGVRRSLVIELWEGGTGHAGR